MIRSALAIRLVALMLLVVVGMPASALVLAVDDGSGNVMPPAGGPSFASVGQRGPFTAVYLGNNWVLTAGHVAQGDVMLGAVLYPSVPGSTIRFENPDLSQPDLRVFKLQGDVVAPAALIASASPAFETEVILMGNGRRRGNPTSWGGLAGWGWASGGTLRWGTNQILQTSFMHAQSLTQSITTDFSDPLTPEATLYEAQVANGDSGGALYVDNAGWEIAGLLYSRTTEIGQPENTSLYSNESIAADLAFYRAAILSVVAVPPCSDGFDDDGDGDVDYPDDLGCDGASDTSERGASLPCDNGLDDDLDSEVDFPFDAGCTATDDLSEEADCSDGLDNDGDGRSDFQGDPHCWDPGDLTEEADCLDGVDNDGDGLVDDPDDPGCAVPTSLRENPQCDDDVDNDGNGSIDWDGGIQGVDPDPDCVGRPGWELEGPLQGSRPGCGLGFEGVALLLGVIAVRQWRRRVR